MPYQDADDGHRAVISGDVMAHARQVFDSGLQLEAILLAHEFLEQRLNQFHNGVVRAGTPTVHRKFKNLIDILASAEILTDEDYAVLNEFNRLRNVNSNLVLNSSLTLRGAKKGDIARAMSLAEESEKIISRLSDQVGSQKPRKKSKKKD